MEIFSKNKYFAPDRGVRVDVGAAGLPAVLHGPAALPHPTGPGVGRCQVKTVSVENVCVLRVSLGCGSQRIYKCPSSQQY